MSRGVLGAVLAGGRSRRFGSDKALALANGRTLLQHALHSLREQCAAAIVVGRDQAPVVTVADWPGADMGPLAGIAGALLYAHTRGFDSVLTVSVDTLGLPAALLRLLGPPPSRLDAQPVIGHWPVTALPVARSILASTQTHSVHAFSAQIGARVVALPARPHNINTVADLEAWQRSCAG